MRPDGDAQADPPLDLDLDLDRARIESAWTVTVRGGSAAALHDLELPDPASREIWILTPERPALVLGSTQTDDIVAAEVLEQRGIDLVRRRSGGGAVLLDPTAVVGATATRWIDLVVPRGDALWDDDVGRSMTWLGEAWVQALAALGVAGEVHRGALERTAASKLVCFAGVGPGEVVVGLRKVVGISQRRSRNAARFQCLVNLDAGRSSPGRPSVDAIVDLLRQPVDADDRTELAERLRARTGAVAASVDALTDALLAALPGPVVRSHAVGASDPSRRPVSPA